MMTGLLLAAILAPLAASIASLITGWRRTTATLTALSATTVLACAVAMGFWMGSGAQFGLGGLLRADALTVVMLVVIGIVGTLATAASIGYIDTELAHGHIDGRSARLYGVLTPAFLCAMVLAVCANNIGVIWVAIEATTVITAFLVGHRRTRTALEATWKYVVICSVGIAVAFLGTVLLYFAARDSGAAAAGALNLDILAEHAAGLDPGVARLAGGLLLIGYGAKAGLFPFHTWLADAHSQAPAPVSALMSGVLLAVAFSVLIRLRPILDAVSGPAYLRNGLLVVGLATLLVAVLMLTVTGDVKRMLAYSSMEHMGLIAIAAAAGTTLAIAALLLHVLAHGIGKTVLFLAGGQLQAAHDSTAIADITGVMRRSRLIGVSFAVGLIVLLGLPPFAMFASELAIARSLANERLAWVLGAALLLIAIGFTALARNSRGRSHRAHAIHGHVVRRAAAAGLRRRAAPGHRHRGHPHRRVALYGRADHLPDRGRRRDRTAPLYAGGRGGGRHGRAAAPCPHRQRAPLPGLRRAGRTDRAGGREVNVMSYLAGAAQIGGVMVGAPLVIGMTRQVRARWEGRAGAGLLQPWRDLLKQLGKQQITPAGTTIVFAAAPVIVAGTTLLIAAIAPLVATGSPLDPSADLFAVVGLLFLGTVALTLAGIDTGTSFGGMGASREITIAALVEPTILLAVFALSIPAGSANLGALVASTIDHPGHVVSLAGVLAFVALVIVIVAETGRLPVDNPATHLELTMVHEAMVLEYAGPRLALVEWAAGMRLTVLLALLANLFLPWGIAGAAPTALDVLTGVVAVAAKVAILAVLLATFEVFLAKLRLFRVPELLAGSFLLALLAVTAANFFTVGA